MMMSVNLINLIEPAVSLLAVLATAGLLKSFDVAKQIERLELPEVRALGPPKHKQQVIAIFITTRWQ